MLLLYLILCSFLFTKVTCDIRNNEVNNNSVMGNKLKYGCEKNSSDIYIEHTLPYLYTSDAPNEPFLLNLTNYKKSTFDGSYSTVVLIHGYRDNGNNDWILDSRQNYFQQSKYNVIVLDWSYFAQYNYFNSTEDIPHIAHYMAEIIVALVKSNELKIQNLQLVGHSLGAHVAGFIGKYVYQILNDKVGRITGLDPAGPLYGIPMLINSKKRLAKGDAIFVDIIHTCAGVLGMPQCIGDADFFPNGGSSQPGCNIFDFNCKHFRSALYYAETIHSELPFVSRKCDSWDAFTKEKCNNNEEQLMGYPVNTTANGKYYLRTNSKKPFSRF